jgi:hypothetical protein
MVFVVSDIRFYVWLTAGQMKFKLGEMYMTEMEEIRNEHHKRRRNSTSQACLAIHLESSESKPRDGRGAMVQEDMATVHDSCGFLEYPRALTSR